MLTNLLQLFIHVCAVHVEVRGQPVGVFSLLPCGFQWLNPGSRGWRQGPPPTVPSCWPGEFFMWDLRAYTPCYQGMGRRNVGHSRGVGGKCFHGKIHGLLERMGGMRGCDKARLTVVSASLCSCDEGQSPPVDETPGEGIYNNRVPFEGSASV